MLKNIKISEEENKNWNSNIIHFHLQNPNFLFNMINDILNSANDLKLKITLDGNEQYLLKRYEVLMNG